MQGDQSGPCRRVLAGRKGLSLVVLARIGYRLRIVSMPEMKPAAKTRKRTGEGANNPWMDSGVQGCGLDTAASEPPSTVLLNPRDDLRCPLCCSEQPQAGAS